MLSYNTVASHHTMAVLNHTLNGKYINNVNTNVPCSAKWITTECTTKSSTYSTQ